MSSFNPCAEPGDCTSLEGKITGRVIIGMDTPGPDEMSVQDIEGKKRLVWDDSVDDEYMSRVRAKAQTMAKEILSKAMSEAEVIKAEAKQAGYDAGIAEAQAELDQHVATISQTMENLLTTVSAQGSTLWDARRQDIVHLIRMAITKVLHVELDAQREQTLLELMEQALERIESQRTITLRVSPQDKELLDALLPQIQERTPAVRQWKAVADPDIEYGGAVVETNQGKVDNSVDTRWEMVQSILDKLTLAAPEAPVEPSPAPETVED